MGWRLRTRRSSSEQSAAAAAATAAAPTCPPLPPGKQAYATNNYQLSLIDPRDRVVMYTALDGICDKL